MKDRFALPLVIGFILSASWIGAYIEVLDGVLSRLASIGFIFVCTFLFLIMGEKLFAQEEADD